MESQYDKQNNFHIISYGSRQLVDAEKSYFPFLLEMQAAVEGMKHYDNYLRGRKFILYTYHKPLEKLGHLHTKTLNCLKLAMLDYDFVIQYKKVSTCPPIFYQDAKLKIYVQLTHSIQISPNFKEQTLMSSVSNTSLNMHHSHKVLHAAQIIDSLL